MALPKYTETRYRIWHYFYIAICTFVFIFLIAPLFVIFPLSFNAEEFLVFSEGMKNLDPDAFSLRWYKDMVYGTKNPMKYSNLLMICVLLPFWTSLLVRTASWMILLQQQGVVNDFFVMIGLVSDDNRPEMMYNKVGTYVAMTQILLPFMVLPLYSVMKTISPSLMRAGKSLGGTPFVAFWKVYFPLTIPGIGAGCLLVFILAIGYYITPALVGGASGTLISNQIAYHMKTTLDWSFASAMGLMLLGGVLVIYWLYNKLVGVDNIKLG